MSDMGVPIPADYIYMWMLTSMQGWIQTAQHVPPPLLPQFHLIDMLNRTVNYP